MRFTNMRNFVNIAVHPWLRGRINFADSAQARLPTYGGQAYATKPFAFISAVFIWVRRWCLPPFRVLGSRAKMPRSIISNLAEGFMKITPGKQKGLKAVADARGVIAAAAMDQRGSLKSAIAKEKGIDKKDVPAQMLEEFKTIVTRVLTPHASAILLDPEYGLPAARARSSNAGLLLAYENSGYDNTRPGRLPDLLDIWSVRRLVGAGADCIKILLYYTPFDPPEVNDIKHAWVERIGGECTASDVPFFLEFVGYVENGDEKGIEYAKQKPEVVRKSMEEFSKPQYGVDVLKVEVPVNMAFVAGTKSCKGESAYTRDQAKEHFRRAAAVAKKPFIYLSAGVNNDVFAETLDLAAESGVEFSGVLCGRATWKDGIPIYAKQGPKALEDWLGEQGVKNINNVNSRLAAAKPWYSFYGATSAAALGD
jgi:tagatose 1,6-diphosphate aldolase